MATSGRVERMCRRAMNCQRASVCEALRKVPSVSSQPQYWAGLGEAASARLCARDTGHEGRWMGGGAVWTCGGAGRGPNLDIAAERHSCARCAASNICHKRSPNAALSLPRVLFAGVPLPARVLFLPRCDEIQDDPGRGESVGEQRALLVQSRPSASPHPPCHLVPPCAAHHQEPGEGGARSFCADAAFLRPRLLVSLLSVASLPNTIELLPWP